MRRETLIIAMSYKVLSFVCFGLVLTMRSYLDSGDFSVTRSETHSASMLLANNCVLVIKVSGSV